jgi:hypothetical protein
MGLSVQSQIFLGNISPSDGVSILSYRPAGRMFVASCSGVVLKILERLSLNQ